MMKQFRRAGLVLTLWGLIWGLSQAQTTEGFPIGAGAYEGNINDATPSVRYRFDLRAGQTADITMQATSGDLDSFLFLFDDAEGLITSNDDEQPGSRSARIIHEAPVDGTYIIETTRFQQEDGTTRGTYLLTLRLSADDSALTDVDPLRNPPPFSVAHARLDYDDFGGGNLDEEQPRRYFAIGGQAGDFMRIILTTTQGDVTIQATLRDTDLATHSRIARLSEGELTLIATLPATGWYLLEVERTSGAGAFSVYATRLAQSVLTAGERTDGQFQAGERTYLFNAALGDRVFATVTADPATGITPQVTLTDLNQQVIANRVAPGNEARLRAIIPLSGTYLLQVGATDPEASGAYELTLRRVPLDVSKLDVPAIAYNTRTKGHIDDETSSRLYRFSGKAGELVTITMQGSQAEADLDPLIVLMDSQLNALVLNDNSGATRNARIPQYALPADGEYFILATRTGLAQGISRGEFDLELTAGQISLNAGVLMITLNWEGRADLNLFVREPDGPTLGWSNPISLGGGRLQIDSNTRCITPSAQPVEHVFYPVAEPPTGDYTIWVWHQDACGTTETVPFSLTVTTFGETLLDLEGPALALGQRYEVSLRMGNESAALLSGGNISTPSAQQLASQGGDILILPGQSLTGRLDHSVFARFYQFDGRAGETIVLTAERLTGDLDPIVVLRDAADRNLASNDDARPDTQDARLVFTLPGDGRYIIAVTRFGLREGRTTGDYRLTLSLEQPD